MEVKMSNFFAFIVTDLLLLITFFTNESLANAKPNVLFIVVDDLRPSLGAYSDKNAYTPNIDKLARKSVVFTKAYAQQALCAPSRNSFLTSRRPDTLHLYDFNSYWRDEVGNFTTLPQYFKENGYFTHSVGKVFHPGISSNYSDDWIYSWSQKPYHPSTEIYENEPTCPDRSGKTTYHSNLICPTSLDILPENTLPDLQILNASLQFLEDRNNDEQKQPFFLAVGFHKPHIPFKFPKKYLDFHPLENVTLAPNRFQPYNLPDIAWNPWTDVRKRHDIAMLNVSFPFGPISDEWNKKIKQSYYAAVSYIDDLIGQLLSKIDKKTIVILIGDHGWSLGEHGEWAKYSNYDVATRVPLIISHLNLSPSYISKPVELLDIFPTIVDLANLEKINRCSQEKEQTCTEGKSLVPLIKNRTNADLAAFTQYPRPTIFPNKSPNSDKPNLKDIKFMGYSIVYNEYRYTDWLYFNNTKFKPDWNKSYGRELYNHIFDADESNNLIDRPQFNWIKEELKTKLQNNVEKKFSENNFIDY